MEYLVSSALQAIWDKKNREASMDVENGKTIGLEEIIGYENGREQTTC